MMATFYVANRDVAHGFINGGSAYMLVFLAVLLLAARRRNGHGYVLLGFGILAFPLGVPAEYERYRRTTRSTVEPRVA